LKSLLALFLFAATASASGVITIEGKLVSITAQDYIVKTDTGTFAIKKSFVRKDQAAKIDRPEVPVKFEVPFAALTKVKPLRQ
jgi:hypothetical protein